MTTSSVDERVIASRLTPGVLGTSGVDRMRHSLRMAETAKPFDKWASDPITTLIRDAIRDMALRGTTPSPTNVDVAYGITCGLQLAARMMEDPSTVYPDVFATGNGRDVVSIDSITETFSTPPDEP